jgi:PHD/YefM family antitoxin component YafN of YafNO toxin-antitoxin module
VIEGIQFVTDDKGKKVAVLIDLERYGKLWESIYDQLLAEERANDKRLPYETVRKRLVRSGKLRA